MKFSQVFHRLLISIVLFFICNDSGLCQYIIRGQVEGINELQGYNVLLLSVKDSSIQEGAFFIEDKFEIESPYISCLVCISSMGYKDTILMINFSYQNETIEIYVELHLVAHAIDEAVIKKNIPIFTMENNSIIMNVDNTPLSKAGNASDVLNKFIRVNVDRKNNVSVLGKGDAIVYLDNREIKSNELLEMISSEEIQKVVVITNPGAEYDAKAKAVVKIITKKDGKLGFGAIINASTGYNVYLQNEINLTLTYRVPKNSVYAFYSLKPQKLYSAEYYTRDYSKLTTPIYMENDLVNTTYFKGHRIKISDRYSKNNMHSIEIQIDANFKNKYEQIDNKYYFTDPNPELQTVFASNINSNNKEKLLSGNFAYEYQSPDKNLNFIFSSDYLSYSYNNTDMIYENPPYIEFPEENHSLDGLRIFSVRSDLTLPVSTSKQIKIGSKYVNANHTSNTEFNDFRYYYNYVENMVSLYSTFLLENPKSILKIGVRGEYVARHYSNSNIKDYDEFNIFPDLNLKYKFSNNLTGIICFTRNIIRPTFQNLNPTKHYIDTLSYSQGNPYLKPEISYSLDITLQYMEYASLNVNYSDIHNSIIMFAENDADNSSVTNLTHKNVANQRTFSINALVPYQFPWLTLYAAIGYIYNAYKDESISEKPFNKPQIYFQTGFNFKLPSNIKFDVLFQYITSGVLGVWYYKDFYNLDLSLQRSFFGNKFCVTFTYNDILNSSGLETYANYHKKYLSYKDYGIKSMLRLTLSYKFSVLKSEFKRNRGIDSERIRIIQNQRL